MDKIIYVCGNPLLENDSLPLAIVGDLARSVKGYSFIELDPNENIKPKNGRLAVIDTIFNAHEITVITDLERLETWDIYSPHDFDLGMNLLLMHKIGKLQKILIFGLPPSIGKKKAVSRLKKLIPKHGEVFFS